jgi:hypothetical protein
MPGSLHFSLFNVQCPAHGKRKHELQNENCKSTAKEFGFAEGQLIAIQVRGDVLPRSRFGNLGAGAGSARSRDQS